MIMVVVMMVTIMMIVVIYDDNDKATDAVDGRGHDDDTDTVFVRRNITLGVYMVIVYHVLSW